ncbi:MAG: BREX-1 system phosphatase PglZ type A [Thermoanaerobaculia bacterium]
MNRTFDDEHARIVFWNDPEREFGETLGELALPGVTVVDLEKVAALELKIRLERDDPEGRYLLYSAGEEPDYEKDWLLDIRLYSKSFRADRASILLAELGLARPQMREHISRRRKFLDSKDRVRKLKALVEPNDDEITLDRKMLAVLAKASQPDLFNIVRTLFHSMVEAGELDLDQVPSSWAPIEKFELDEPFWQLVSSTFGYQEESASLRNLLIRLFVADYLFHSVKEPPVALQSLLLPRSGQHNAVTCLSEWRDSSSKASSYNSLSAEVGARLHLAGLLENLEAEDVLDVMTFSEVERAIVRSLLARVGPAEGATAEGVLRITSHRLAGHWVTSASVPEAQRRALESIYVAIAQAAEFFELRKRYQQGFDFADATAMYKSYEAELYRFDQLHRQFCWNADRAAAQGWDLLKPLRAEIEAAYRNGYLTQLGLAWGKFVESGLLQKWRLSEVPNQFEFYSRQVDAQLGKSDRNRVFVIVSDALRFEIAQELTTLLNGTYRFEADLSSQLGVLPSYTALGMASLLPHERLEYSANGDVLVDGKGTTSFEQRNAILGTVGGMAVRAGELLDLKKEEGRALVEGRRVVYIYHDEIDARGDKAATEDGTFDAARKAVDDLADLVRHVINHLNGNHVLITADHGFLFTESAPNETDKSALTEKPAGTIVAKKRYLLGRGLPDSMEAWHGRTADTARAEGGMEFWIPKGANRFHFIGGARFVHGGAMLQEIVVPIVTVKHVRDKGAREKTRSRSVHVQVLGLRPKITAPRHRFELLQTEAVSDRTKAITLKVAVYEGETPVTSIETVTFDSSSDSLNDRKKSVVLTLQERPFDKKIAYRLVLRDSETGIEQGSVDVIIDRAISDDFSL